VQIFDAFNSLEYFVLKIRHIAKAQPLYATSIIGSEWYKK
jgi:hypothetical protein